MGKRLVVFVLAASMTVLVAGVTAFGDEDVLPDHAHVLLINAELSGTPPQVSISYDKCVDLAGNRAVPLHAHHERLHVGSSGVSGLVFDGASANVVIPSKGLAPWKNCDELGLLFPPNE